MPKQVHIFAYTSPLKALSNQKFRCALGDYEIVHSAVD
jgi:superfamily II RNA helicase